MDSETESHTDFHEEFENDQIDSFITEETDYIMDLYYDLQDRIPYFLDKARFPDIMSFIIDNKFGLYKNNKIYDTRDIEYFMYEYNSEINASFYIINNYLQKYKRFSLEYDVFTKFAYDFTTIC
jgi:hypothetical protein